MNGGFSRVLRSRPLQGKKCRDVRRMVIVKMSDENIGNAAKRKSGLNGGFESTVSTVNEIRSSVYDHRI
jgi:hypothetical protein